MINIELRSRLLGVLVKNWLFLWLTPLSLLLTSILQATPAPSKVYFLGNSFTWDAQPQNISTATAFQSGLEPEIGFGIYSGKSLTYIVDNPTEAVTEVGLVASDFYPDPNYTRNFEIDLPGNSWDAISMQPHTYGGGLFLETEIAAAKTIISSTRQNSNNSDTIFFIMGPWAFQEGPDKNNGRTYSENWTSGYSENQLNDGVLPNVRQAFRALYWDRLKIEVPDVTINWIPVGQAVYKLDQELQNGAIPGLSGVWELFDEYGVHLADTDSNGIALRYLAHITALSTIWASHPSTFTTKYNDSIDPDFKSLVDEVVWNTVQEFLPAYTVIEINPNPNLILHPGLPEDYLKSPKYRVRAHAEDGGSFRESAVLYYATNIGDDPIRNDPFNTSNAEDRDALKESSHWTNVSYGNDGNSLEFEISLASGAPVTSCEVLPSRYNVSAKIENNKAYLSLHAPNRYLYLIVNDNKEQPLFLFVDPLEENPPRDGDDGVLFFGPGIHDIGLNFSYPENIHTIYLALGSYVKGSIVAEGRSDITVSGRGILSAEGYGFDTEKNAAVHFRENGTGLSLNGITSIRPIKQHVISEGTLHAKNLKCFSYNHSTHGIESGKDSIVENSFFKINGDVVKLHFDNQIIRDLVIYHQTAGSIFELSGSPSGSKDSLIERVDIVQDDAFDTNAEGQPIISWSNNSRLGNEQIGHIFDDIRAEKGIKCLADFNLDQAYGFANIVCQDWSIREVEEFGEFYVTQPGSIKMVFENVMVNSTHVSKSDFTNINRSPLQLSVRWLYDGAAPEIIFQPDSLLSAPGEDLMLQVDAVGLGAFDYQWYKNSLPMPGATDSKFELKNITPNAEAEYFVRITSILGTTQSKKAVVTFSTLDQSINFPAPNPVSIGEETLAIDVTATSDLAVDIEVRDGPATIENGMLVLKDYGEITLRATQNGNGIWSPAAAVEQVINVYSRLDIWRKENLGTFKNEEAASDNADPDADLIPNVMEFFLGTSPLEVDKVPILSVVKDHQNINFKTTQAANSVAGLDVAFEISSDLTSWAPIAQRNVSTQKMTSGDLQHSVTTTNFVSPYFLRVKVESL